jgi:nucleoside-diphosphate-sugar epimerase
VVVNILTNQAYHNREVTIFGGDQLRPNIHIADMVDAYLLLLAAESATIAGRIYNAGYENQSVLAIADEVRSVIGDDVRVVRKESNDNRSYHISSALILDELGFRATRTIADAVRDLKDAFDTGLLPDSLTDEQYFNIKRMQSIDLQ